MRGAKRRGNPERGALRSGLLRDARKDEIFGDWSKRSSEEEIIARLQFRSLADARSHIGTTFGQLPIIGIDGWMGVGKTTFAREIADLDSKRWAIDLDAFLIRNQGKFVGALQLPSLAAAIKSATAPIIVSGVCLLEVAKAIGLRLDSHIYIKRMNAGIWADEGDAIGSDLETFKAAGFAPSDLSFEVHDYHAKFRPHEFANTVVEIETSIAQV